MATYIAHFELPSQAITALIDPEGDGKNTLERIDDEWVPLEESSYESLSGTIVATMNEEFVPVFDDAERENRTLYRWEVEDYIVDNSENE